MARRSMMYWEGFEEPSCLDRLVLRISSQFVQQWKLTVLGNSWEMMLLGRSCSDTKSCVALLAK